MSGPETLTIANGRPDFLRYAAGLEPGHFAGAPE